MILITGGARSGKSAFAEKLAGKEKKVLYIATAVPFDDEMRERVEKHRMRRPENWDTHEGYCALDKVIYKKSSDYDCILVDCATILVTNLLFDAMGEEDAEVYDFEKASRGILEEMERIAFACGEAQCTVIFVTNEIGMGVVPENRLSRHFRDIAGSANQILARQAEEVYFVVSGIPLKMKGEGIQ